MKNRLTVYSNDLGFSLCDWISPREKNKLIKALKVSKGWTFLTVIKNLNDFTDCYYINGNIIFKRNLK